MVYSTEKSDKEVLYRVKDGLKKLEKNLIVVLYEFTETCMICRGESAMETLKSMLDENMTLLDKLIAQMA